MQAHDFEIAWRHLDRIELPRRRGECRRMACHTVWGGNEFKDRRVFVRSNRSLGDTIQFSRFLPWITQAKARRLKVCVQTPLVNLLTGAPGFGEICDENIHDPMAGCDMEAEITELAYAFRATTKSMPIAPFLSPTHVRSRASRHGYAALSEIQHHAGRMLRVGVVWESNAWNPARSLPLQCLSALQPFLHGVRFFSLQHGLAAAGFDRAPIPMVPLHRHTEDAADCALAMQGLDAVISVDTFSAHLAGAVGCPVFVLLQSSSDWRWGTGATTPWYSQMHLFRQPAVGDWTGAVQELVNALPAVLRPRQKIFG